jgi:hypothetical protein
MKKIFALIKLPMDIALMFISIFITVALFMLIYLYVLKNKSDIRVKLIQQNPVVQQNIPEYTTVQNNYATMIPNIDQKLKSTYPELQ